MTRPVGTEQFPHILAAGFSYKEHERQNFKQAEQDHLEQEPHRPAVETMHLFRHEQHCVVNLEPPWSRINNQINSTTTVRFWRWCYKIQGQARGYGRITSFACSPHGANTSNLNNSLMAQYFCNFISV